MDKIELTTTIRVLSSFKGKSKIRLWCLLQPGDIIKFTIKLTVSRSQTNYILVQINKNPPLTMGSGQIHQYFQKIDWEYL